MTSIELLLNKKNRNDFFFYCGYHFSRFPPIVLPVEFAFIFPLVMVDFLVLKWSRIEKQWNSGKCCMITLCDEATQPQSLRYVGWNNIKETQSACLCALRCLRLGMWITKNGTEKTRIDILCLEPHIQLHTILASRNMRANCVYCILYSLYVFFSIWNAESQTKDITFGYYFQRQHHVYHHLAQSTWE